MPYQVSKQQQQQQMHFSYHSVISSVKVKSLTLFTTSHPTLTLVSDDRLEYETQAALFHHLTHSKRWCNCSITPFTHRRHQSIRKHKLDVQNLEIYFRDAEGRWANAVTALHLRPRAEDLQSECSPEDRLVHMWGTVSMLVKASKYEQRIWTKTKHYVNTDLDTG